jgi:5,10-methylenetetrahydromethanopterin reductase
MDRVAIGMCMDRTFSPPHVVEFARLLEDGGADQVWVIEDCFFTAGVSLAAAVATATERIEIGIGILPAVSRNPAVTAMEIATLCALAPGRILPGIGHGVQAWMQQMGARTPSPLTALDEVITAVTRLLAGELVTMHGDFVHLDRVRLDQPPRVRPPVLAGVRGPRSLLLAGQVAGGVVLAEPAGPSYVRAAIGLAGHPVPFHVAVFSALCIDNDPLVARRTMAPWLAGLMTDPNAGLRALPFFDELLELYVERGVDGLAAMPAGWWTEIGPIGTMDDAAAHLAAVIEAGAHSIGLFPAPRPEVARFQLDQVLELSAILR